MSDAKYIFIIGAMKCGTTALADLLDQQAAVCLSNPKEPAYFNKWGQQKGLEWYESCFKRKSTPYRLDASVSYSAGWGDSSKEEARRIYEFSQDAKIIYVVRDPIQRTWSHYWHEVRNLKERRSFAEATKNRKSQYISGSEYHKRLDEYLEFFDRDNIFVTTQRQVAEQPIELVNRINQFIGLETRLASSEHTSRRANTSYQFNAIGAVLMRAIPLSFVSAVATWSYRHLPEGTNRFIGNMISKPVDKISEEDALRLREIFEHGVDDLFHRYGVDVKESQWWFP